MLRKFLLILANAGLMATPVSAADSASFNLRLRVDVHCTVQHQPVGYGVSVGGAVSLGQFREYCNAPNGYELVVSYTPGTLRGATIVAGDDRTILNGSGQAVLSRATGPRVRERMVTAIPGDDGFDTDRLELRIVPSLT
jgi:hypothetical protein